MWPGNLFVWGLTFGCPVDPCVVSKRAKVQPPLLHTAWTVNPKNQLMFIPLSTTGVYTPYKVGWKPRRGMNKGNVLPPKLPPLDNLVVSRVAKFSIRFFQPRHPHLARAECRLAGGRGVFLDQAGAGLAHGRRTGGILIRPPYLGQCSQLRA